MTTLILGAFGFFCVVLLYYIFFASPTKTRIK